MAVSAADIPPIRAGDRTFCKVRSEAMGRRSLHVFRCEPSRVTCVWCDLCLDGR